MLTQNPYSYSAIAGANMMVTIEWVKNGMKESPEEMARYISELGF